MASKIRDEILCSLFYYFFKANKMSDCVTKGLDDSTGSLTTFKRTDRMAVVSPSTDIHPLS